MNKHDIKVLYVSQESDERHYDTPQIDAFWREIEIMLLKRDEMAHHLS